MKLYKPLLIASSVFVLAACGVTTPSDQTPKNETIIDLRATDNQYAFATYTGLRMIEEISATTNPQALRATDEESDADAELELVNRYLTLYKELTEEGVLDVAMAEISDRPEYAFQLTITTTDIDKVTSTITLYFNEAVIESDDEIDDEIDDTGEEVLPGDGTGAGEQNGSNYRHREDPRDEGESTILVGLAVIGEEEFAVDGYRLVSEEGIRFGFRAQLEDGRILRVAQNSETNRQTFRYFLRNRNVLIAQKKVIVENDDVSAHLLLEEVNDGVRSRYSFRKLATDEGTYYKIRFMTPEGKGTIHVYVTVDELGAEVLEYYFSNGGMYHHDGNGNHHGERPDNGGEGHGGNGGQGGNGNHGSCPNQEDDDDYEDEFADLND